MSSIDTSMGSRSQTRAAKDGTRDRLLRAAIRLIVERGFDRVNTNLIAREAGVGVGTFYHHFRDKYALRRQLVLHALEGLAAELQRQGPPPDELAQQVAQAIEAHVAFAEREPALFRAAFGPEGGGVAASGHAAVGPSTRAIERRLAALQASGEVDSALDPAVAARAFASMQAGVLAWWLEDPTRADRAAIVTTLTRLHPALARS